MHLTNPLLDLIEISKLEYKKGQIVDPNRTIYLDGNNTSEPHGPDFVIIVHPSLNFEQHNKSVAKSAFFSQSLSQLLYY